jgi:transcriptional regulator GlxA family with amidase domain
MHLYTIANTMDPVSTQLPQDKQPSDSKFGQLIVPTHTFKTAPPLDVLVVPGGQGSRAAGLEPAIDFIKEVYPSLQYIISICTGASLVAQAGVLDGKRATTNKLSWQSTITLRSEVDWVHRARWVQDGNVWTSSGISAGIDATLAWIEHVHGSDVAKAIADRMEYNRVTDADDDPFAELYGLTKKS